MKTNHSLELLLIGAALTFSACDSKEEFHGPEPVVVSVGELVSEEVYIFDNTNRMSNWAPEGKANLSFGLKGYSIDDLREINLYEDGNLIYSTSDEDNGLFEIDDYKSYNTDDVKIHCNSDDLVFGSLNRDVKSFQRRNYIAEFVTKDGKVLRSERHGITYGGFGKNSITFKRFGLCEDSDCLPGNFVIEVDTTDGELRNVDLDSLWEGEGNGRVFWHDINTFYPTGSDPTQLYVEFPTTFLGTSGEYRFVATAHTTTGEVENKDIRLKFE